MFQSIPVILILPVDQSGFRPLAQKGYQQKQKKDGVRNPGPVILVLFFAGKHNIQSYMDVQTLSSLLHYFVLLIHRPITQQGCVFLIRSGECSQFYS